MFFRNHNMMTAMGGNPQYYSSVPTSRPALNAQMLPVSNDEELTPVRMPETVTTGFVENEPYEFSLHYGRRAQPDVGGALNYAYENYGLPLVDVCGAFMVAKFPIPPIGSRPMMFYQTSPETSIGGLIPGQLISQPLLNPMDLGSGYDIYD